MMQQPAEGSLQVESKERDTGNSGGNLLIMFGKCETLSGLRPQVLP